MNINRRKMLKFLAIGGGIGLIAKFLGDKDFFGLFSASDGKVVNKKDFDSFTIVEKQKELKIFSKDGDELFVIDNEK